MLATPNGFAAELACRLRANRWTEAVSLNATDGSSAFMYSSCSIVPVVRVNAEESLCEPLRATKGEFHPTCR